MKDYSSVLFVMLLLFVAIFGCNGAKDREITGVVLTAPDLWQSSLGAEMTITDEYKPIAGARIRLAFDEKEEQPLKGYETTSDAAGRYTIKLRNLPRSLTRYGNDYYLLVKKEGYEPLAAHISVGPLGHYMRNSVVLKPLSAPKHDPKERKK